MFEDYRKELERTELPILPLVEKPIEQSVSSPRQHRAYPISGNFDEVPIEDLDAFLAARDKAAKQSAPAAFTAAPKVPIADMGGVDLNGLLGLIGSFIGNNDAATAAQPESVQDTIQPLFVDGEAIQFVAKRRLNTAPIGRIGKKTTELIGNQSPRRRFAAVGGLAIGALLAFGLQSHHGSIDQANVKLTAPASLINQGAGIATIDAQFKATVRIPVAGFSKPLLFMERGQAVEPASTLNDTISITLATRLDKKGNALPLAGVKNADTFEVNRSNIEVIANFDNFLGLNIDCINKATTAKRYCVAGSPVKLQASGNFKAATANQLNDLLTTQGKNFDTYYRGVKAQIAVAGLAAAEQGTCGSQIFGLADQVIKSLLQKQSATAKIQFAPNSHYPSISQAYAASFSGLVANKEFSIERGDSSNAIPDSLHVICQVTPTNH